MAKDGVVRIIRTLAALLMVLVCLYFFVCSLNLLADALRLLGGRNAGKVFSQSEALSNPVVEVMIGVLATATIQSSSTTTSIVIGMVAAEILQVRQAIFMVMGANIGTSVTNTVVSLTQVGERDEFERAFACAVHHDVFNWLGVVFLLPLEAATSYLYHLTNAVLTGIEFAPGSKPTNYMKLATSPLVNLIIQIDKKVLKGWSLGDPSYDNVTSLLKVACERNTTSQEYSDSRPLLLGEEEAGDELQGSVAYPCGYLFAYAGLSDTWSGLILLILSLILLWTCLVIMVKMLKLLMQDKVAVVLKNSLNADFPCCPWLTGYVAILVGAITTVVIQSSSVFTSTLTPLCGAGLFMLERAYPLTLGANIGTTTTGMLAALASDPEQLHDTLQIALVHLFFNLSAILLFFPLPAMRWPVPAGHAIAAKVARYPWAAFVYVVGMFFLLPTCVISLSLVSSTAVYAVFLPLFFLLATIVVINVLQVKHPKLLPPFLRDWNFLPLWLHSMEPYNRVLLRMAFWRRFDQLKSSRRKGQDELGPDSSSDEEAGEEEQRRRKRRNVAQVEVSTPV